MSLIQELGAELQPPAYAEILEQFPRVNIAKKLKISPSYVGLIFTGARTPGKPLEKRLMELAAQVASELA